MRRLLLCLVIGLICAALGPRVFGPQNKSAGSAFGYEPPERFALVKEPSVTDQGAQAWAYQGSEADAAPVFPTGRPAVDKHTRVTVVLHHSAKEISVDEGDLAKLATEMAKAFEDVCSWSHRRHELRVRSDGARVGLIDGDCNRTIDLRGVGLPEAVIKLRKLQLIFPDDTGTSIVTASYPSDQAARWEPVFEATINKAKGVATRVPPPPPWHYGAFGGAGLVMGWLLAALVLRDKPPAPSEVATVKKQKKKRPREEESADRDASSEEDG